MATFIVVIFFLVSQLLSLLLVLFLGVLFSILLRGLTNHLTRYTGLGDPWALLVVIATLVAIFGVTGWLMAPAIADQASQIGDKVPEAIDQLRNWLETTSIGSRGLLRELDNLNLSQLMRGADLGPLGGAVFGVTVATPLTVLLMALINMIYVEDVLGDTTPFTEMVEKYH